jgi:hypothetical protein
MDEPSPADHRPDEHSATAEMAPSQMVASPGEASGLGCRLQRDRMPIAAGVFQPAFGLVLRPELAALSMSGSSVLVAANALFLKKLRLPGRRVLI